MNKRELRNSYLSKRLNLNPKDLDKWSETICLHISQFCNGHRYIKKIFIFSSIKNEPNIINIQNFISEKKTIAIPRINNKEIQFYELNETTHFDKSPFGIREPSIDSHMIDADESTLILVPNLAIDRQGYRLGYGGGFYDRYLSMHSSSIAMGVTYSEFFVEKVPRDPWDYRVQWICTERGLVNVI